MPAIIHPHAGQIGDTAGAFNYFVQYLNSRGYAVRSPTTRGIAGFGINFLEDELGGYGQEMQDDLEDSARWLVKMGIADEERICIVGGYYGGYAALMGVVKTPEFYRCAISFAGVSDLVEFRNFKRKFVGGKILRQQIGTDNAELRATSPAYHAERIKAPVLLAHGDRDRTVPITQSNEMAKELRRAKKEVVYLKLEDGSHFLNKQENRTALFEAIEAFLAKHLPVEN